jgi:2-polyprenyl-6-methoxyphenol hydroxylase-like FAD-dependent oxidoreductase
MTHQLKHSLFSSDSHTNHALVIGGGMAGLIAAHVLSDTFDQVTIVDRDRLSDKPEARQGVPQARHPHTLMVRGQEILEQHFPGLTAELMAQGALPIDASREVAFYVAGQWRAPARHADTMSIAMSRPLLEATIYRRVVANPHIKIIHAHDVTRLTVDAERKHVMGVYMRDRAGAPSAEKRATANLVLDASGRYSRVPQWLQGLGYEPPAEITVNALTGYSTRLYQRPADFAEGWQAMYIRPTLLTGSRGGMIIPVEGNRWNVALVGMNGDFPPTNEAGYVDFARSLPTSELYKAIGQAEPLTKPIGYRHTENRLRRYDQLPRYLEGLLVYGDAACALNPVHAHGITAVAIGSLALSESLQAHFTNHAAGDIDGLAAAFQKQLGQSLAGLWHSIANEDRRWPKAEVTTSESRRIDHRPRTGTLVAALS